MCCYRQRHEIARLKATALDTQLCLRLSVVWYQNQTFAPLALELNPVRSELRHELSALAPAFSPLRGLREGLFDGQVAIRLGVCFHKPLNEIENDY